MSITGPAALDARFPGQWFQLGADAVWASEALPKSAGLHYNWHRHYDPSLGRYTQPDPLGFVDGPGVYGYARSRPIVIVDKDGLRGVIWVVDGNLSTPIGGVDGGSGHVYDSEIGHVDFYYSGYSFGAGGGISFQFGVYTGSICDLAGKGAAVGLGAGFFAGTGFASSNMAAGGMGGIGLGSPVAVSLALPFVTLDPESQRKCACREKTR